MKLLHNPVISLQDGIASLRDEIQMAILIIPQCNYKIQHIRYHPKYLYIL